jgi:1,4-dihydroxy-6-naphthoate synthase
VSANYDRIEDLRGKTIAVGGLSTTGAALAMMYCPCARFVEMPYDGIADAVAAGAADAGVMIHEELLYWPEKGLRRICCLGQRWGRETGLPLTVGLNVARRALGDRLLRDVDATCRESLRWAHRNHDEALAFASTFGHGLALQFVEMFSNHDTLRLPDDARRALRLIFDRVAAMGIAPHLPELEVIDA